jgi:hypothetical protein
VQQLALGPASPGWPNEIKFPYCKGLKIRSILVRKLHFGKYARCFRGAERGAAVLNPQMEDAVVSPKRKHTMLPVLIVLFLVSYGLMALLVVEQGRTIDSQRNLIRQLFSDSTELSAMKGHEIQKQHAEAQAQAEAQANAHSQAKTPSAQAPREHAKSDNKVLKPVPLPKPPQDTSEMTDRRRALLSI